MNVTLRNAVCYRLRLSTTEPYCRNSRAPEVSEFGEVMFARFSAIPTITSRLSFVLDITEVYDTWQTQASVMNPSSALNRLQLTLNHYSL